jgi:hypothetical protein
MRRLVLPALLAVVACSNTNGPEALTLNGTWTQSADLREAATGDRHINYGSFTFAQTGDDFDGTGTQGIDAFCSTAASVKYTGPLADPAPFAANGALTGRTVSFARTGPVSCEYSGSFAEGRSNRITGTATCRYTTAGVEHVFAGQWQADKR